jgi:hypothetical protein
VKRKGVMVLLKKDKGKKEHSKDGPKKTTVNKTEAQEDETENSAAESEDSGDGATTAHFGKHRG